MLKKDASPADGVGVKETPAWTPMKHIEIVMTGKELFAIAFDPADIPLLPSPAGLAAKIREIRNA